MAQQKRSVFEQLNDVAAGIQNKLDIPQRPAMSVRLFPSCDGEPNEADDRGHTADFYKETDSAIDVECSFLAGASAETKINVLVRVTRSSNGETVYEYVMEAVAYEGDRVFHFPFSIRDFEPDAYELFVECDYIQHTALAFPIVVHEGAPDNPRASDLKDTMKNKMIGFEQKLGYKRFVMLLVALFALLVILFFLTPLGKGLLNLLIVLVVIGVLFLFWRVIKFFRF